MPKKQKPSCFVIMPFSVRANDLSKYSYDNNHWNEVYNGLIAPAVESAGMRLERDDDDLSSRLIVEGIWRKLESADVVLCDLSAHNPNVYLELGWTLRADKKFILIKDEITNFSFDLNQLHTSVYDSRLQPSTLKRDVKNLADAIQTTYSDNNNSSSLVQRMALSTKIELEPSGDSTTNLLEMIYQKLDGGALKSTMNHSEPDKKDRVIVIDPSQIYPMINTSNTLDWPSEELKTKSGQKYWGSWEPSVGDKGKIIHETWNSIEEEVVYIVELDGHFVPINAKGTKRV